MIPTSVYFTLAISVVVLLFVSVRKYGARGALLRIGLGGAATFAFGLALYYYISIKPKTEMATLTTAEVIAPGSASTKYVGRPITDTPQLAITVHFKNGDEAYYYADATNLRQLPKIGSAIKVRYVKRPLAPARIFDVWLEN